MGASGSSADLSRGRASGELVIHGCFPVEIWYLAN